MSIDKERFAAHLRAHAATMSTRKCAAHVRRALEAGGADTSGHPVDAKDYGPTLVRNGFHAYRPLSLGAYLPVKGDVVVIEPASTGNRSGHIQGYDGKQWISDFVQSGFWPGPAYRKETPNYVIYRP
nr:hypothetical protein [uncultured Duganella sp.]